MCLAMKNLPHYSQPSGMLKNYMMYINDDDEPIAAQNEELRHLQVDDSGHHTRLDRFLATALPEFSRNHLQQLIAQGLLQRNGKLCAKPATRLVYGDTLALVLRPTAQSTAFVAQDIALDVVYEDAHLAIINKPVGMVVYPAAGNWSGTLLNALLHRYPKAVDVLRAGIVHRLDKNTSGLMVVARTQAVAEALSQQIAARTVQRNYWALAHGHWQQPLGADITVDAPIGRDPRQRVRMAVVDTQRHPGKAARTTFTLLGNSTNTPNSCWLHCSLHTGRTHQIRVHLQHIKHPILADNTYTGAPAYNLQRQALHAVRLCLQHPITNQALQCSVLPPDDMQAAIVAMGLQLPTNLS